MTALARIFDGWDGYQTSLAHAIEPLTGEQLRWRPSSKHRSVGELARHISLGRVTWFLRMQAPGSAEIAGQIGDWYTDSDGNRHINEDAITIAEDAAALVESLQSTWQMIQATLNSWEASDLGSTYQHRFNGDLYEVSYQWTVWRIMAHDIHHGGELSLMLGVQGVEAFELSALGGHITMPPLAGE